MKLGFNSLKVSITGILFFLVIVQVDTTSGSCNQTPVLLEIVYSCCAGLENEFATTRIYADGHYVREQAFQEEAKSGGTRRVVYKHEKDLEPSELEELLMWARAPDFLSANQEYVVTIVKEYPDWITITYRDKGEEKKVTVFNYSRGNPEEKGKVPRSFMKLARWADPYSFLFQ